jgi:hypothetical protein
MASSISRFLAKRSNHEAPLRDLAAAGVMMVAMLVAGSGLATGAEPTQDT